MSFASHRTRFAHVFLGMLVLAGLLALAFGARSSRAADAELYFYFTQAGSIRLALPDGTPIAGNTIPAGPYQVVIYNDFRDDNGIVHMLHLTGPGVDLLTDMNQGEQDHASWRYTLQANATYTWEDEYRPTVLSGSFRTSGTEVSGGTSSGGTSSGGTSSGGGSSGGTSGGGSAAGNTSVVGSRIVAFRGTLTANVATSGKLTLRRSGKTVATLKSGRYRIAVLDETSRSAFKLKKSNRRAVTLSGAAFVGRKTKTVTLVAGQWLFYSTPKKKSYFIVVA